MLKASETGLIPDSELALARRDLSEEQYAQEFECSFDAAIVGAYYGKLMAQAEQDTRIAGVPYDPAAPVWTAWDLGIRDATAIWFAQVIGREIRIIDYYEASGVDLGHYVRELNARPYVYAGHIVPHDAQARELGTGKSRLEVLESLGLKNRHARRRCIGSRTASTPCACSCRSAGSTQRNARAASMRSSSTAPNMTTSCRL